MTNNKTNYDLVVQIIQEAKEVVRLKKKGTVGRDPEGEGIHYNCGSGTRFSTLTGFEFKKRKGRKQ